MLRHFDRQTAAIKNAEFGGVCFDVEETHHEAEMIPAMQAAFASCKEAGLRVMVTTSHSAPYRYDSNPRLVVDSWRENPNIDILSPQLYTSTREKSPDFTASSGVGWSSWRGARAQILPSLVDGSHYAASVSFFALQGITLGGYIQWKETRLDGNHSRKRRLGGNRSLDRSLRRIDA